MNIEKLYATLGRLDVQLDCHQLEVQRLIRTRGQLLQQIQQAEQEAEKKEPEKPTETTEAAPKE
jgi:hypothetical protein